MSIAFLLAFTAAAPAPLNTADERATRAMHQFGSCIVEESPRGAREALALDYRTEEYQNKLRAVARGHDRCLVPGWEIRFSPVLGAGALAEALVKFDVKPAELPRRLAYDPAREVIAARSPTEAMALCTVMKAPDATARLFATEPATPEETRAMQPLGPVLMDCLKKDVKLELNKPALRSVLALAAWRILATPRKAATP